MDETIRRQIASWCRDVWAITSNEHITTSDAVERAGVPKEWRVLITCLLQPGWYEMIDWCADNA